MLLAPVAAVVRQVCSGLVATEVDTAVGKGTCSLPDCQGVGACWQGRRIHTNRWSSHRLAFDVMLWVVVAAEARLAHLDLMVVVEIHNAVGKHVQHCYLVHQACWPPCHPGRQAAKGSVSTDGHMRGAVSTCRVPTCTCSLMHPPAVLALLARESAWQRVALSVLMWQGQAPRASAPISRLSSFAASGCLCDDLTVKKTQYYTVLAAVCPASKRTTQNMEHL